METTRHPTGLRVDHEERPPNVAPERPRFEWRVGADRRGAAQSAYRVQVARKRAALDDGDADCWDTGRVESDQSSGVTYDGVSLAPDETYWWRVRVWNEAGDASAWSDPARLGTALDGEANWAGEWISHQPGPGDTNGFRTAWLDPDDGTAWVQVDLGAETDLSRIELHPAAPHERIETPDGTVLTPLHGEHGDDPDVGSIDGFGFPERYRIEVADDPDFADAETVVDRTGEPQDSHGDEPVPFDVEATARYVRVVATDLYVFDPARSNVELDFAREERTRKGVFALAALAARDENGTDHARGNSVEASSAVETRTWGADHLTNGVYESRLACSSPLLRTEFDLPKPVERARAHVVGLGYGELHVNGEKAGEAVLDPAWTEYGERVLYRTVDVTDALSEGANALGLWLGRGRFSTGMRGWAPFGSPRGRVHLSVEFADGTTTTIGTDEDWRAASSPLVENDLYDGETYDARRERDGWADPGFDDSDWGPAVEIPGPGGDLEPERIEPMAPIEAFDPVKIHDHEDGPVIDFGQNLTGWLALTIRGAERGEAVTLRHAEALDDDGGLRTIDLRSADATDTYVPRGEETESYEPRFTYHGFRYAQITGYPGDLDPADVTAKAVTTAMERRGTFDCSDEDLRQVQHNAVWGLRSNTHSVPEDCPQRDERFGWTGDAHITSQALQYNFDAARFHGKWLRDHDDVQSRHGYVSDTIPRGFGSIPGDPTWTITRVLLPWHQYQHHGDRGALAESYEGMRRYVDFWHARTEDGILPGEYGNYGDWLAFEEPLDGRRGLPFDLFNTAYHYRAIDVLARAAGVLDHEGDADRYGEMAQTVADAFNDRFLTEDGTYEPGTQSAHAVPLFFGMVPEARVDDVVATLVEKIHADDDRLRTGFLGTRPLLLTLAEHGHAEVAHQIVSQPEKPGWVYMARQGATTMWERWDSDEQVGSGMNSLNHSPFTFVSEWFYEVLAGIRFDGPYDEGFEIRPEPVGDLDWAEASVETRHGDIESRWERTDDGFELAVAVPWNTTATVRVPAEDGAEIRLGGDPAWDDGPASLPSGVESARSVADGVAFEVTAGSYRFAVE